jgi:hypothetical protein
MAKVPLQVSLSGDDLPSLFTAVAAEPPFGGAGAPEWFMLDGKRQAGKPVPPAAKVKKSIYLHLGNQHFVSYDVDAVVKASGPGWTPSAQAVLGLVERLPAALASVRGVYPEWDDDPSAFAMNLGFGNLHHPYGAFAAFKGKGHDRLVSRRWLEHGPWKLHKGKGDVSVIQFHDLNADPRTAYAQAKKGWQHLGPDDAGGLFWPKFTRQTTLRTQYSGRDKRAMVVIESREVKPREMLDLRSLVGETTSEGKVERVGFVYMDEGQAKRDLHALWTRGIEVWTYVRGAETRIDESYSPPPARSPW